MKVNGYNIQIKNMTNDDNGNGVNVSVPIGYQIDKYNLHKVF
jgi:hypothetical protein